MDGVEWLRALLKIHKDEMARRRTPRWFIPAGGGKWMLHDGVATLSNDDEKFNFYNYRTANLLNLAREVGCRL